MKHSRLKQQRTYLAGAMDRALDRGKEWRNEITPFLENLGIIVYDPLKKPTTIGLEDDEVHKHKSSLKKCENYDQLTTLMKTIRSVDLRMVDISDFLIVNLDLDVHPCGTYEEIFWANRQKKPIIIHMVQGKKHTPDWLFGVIPHEMIFSSWDEIKKYIIYVHTSSNILTFNRWIFLNK
jgi:nucleoside 2-deoxyribosyltransferase